MKRWAAVLAFLLTVSASAAAQGPKVYFRDNKLSVDADSVSLSRLLQLVDSATGMKSKVPADLANRSVSVQFSNLTLSDGVRKLFQGQPFDYVFVEGRSIIVTAASQTISSPEAAPTYNTAPAQPDPQSFVQELPPGLPPVQTNPAQPQTQQPPTIQTPFGPIANPRALQPQPGQPTPVSPIQQNPLFPQSGPASAQQPSTPFGATTPFATPNAPPNNQTNSLFGSTPVFGAPANPQR
jgi:hypothetical protein